MSSIIPQMGVSIVRRGEPLTEGSNKEKEISVLSWNVLADRHLQVSVQL